MSPARFQSDSGTERRAAVELRAVAGRRLVGCAVAWDTVARIGGAFDETVRRGAFAASLHAAGADQLALVDHDATKLLGQN